MNAPHWLSKNLADVIVAMAQANATLASQSTVAGGQEVARQEGPQDE
jgi:hypothetical protein